MFRGRSSLNPDCFLYFLDCPFLLFYPLKADSKFKAYYEISRDPFTADTKIFEADLNEVIYERAQRAKLIDPKLEEISRNYPPSVIYQFVEEVLEDSDDIILWQEQVMELLHRMGGFSYAEADILRRDGGKGYWRNAEWYSPRRKRFLEHAVGCVYNFRFADKYFRYIFEANHYTRVKAAVAAQVLFD